MILPDRYLASHESLIGVAALIISGLTRPRTVNQLWERSREHARTFDRFVLGLDLLFLLGAIEYAQGELRLKP